MLRIFRNQANLDKILRNLTFSFLRNKEFLRVEILYKSYKIPPNRIGPKRYICSFLQRDVHYMSRGLFIIL